MPSAASAIMLRASASTDGQKETDRQIAHSRTVKVNLSKLAIV